MAVYRAVVTRLTPVSPEATWLDLKLVDDESLDFVGGQYVIVNTGLVFPDGRAVKRAYSIASADAEQGNFSLAVRRIGDGPGSNHMLARQVGDEIVFSGPWGKFLPLDSALRERIVVLATDTGITAALGLVNARTFAPQLPRTRVIWLTAAAEEFLPEAWIRACLPSALASFEVSTLPAGNRPERAWALLRESIGPNVPSHAFLVGDGAVGVALRDRLIAEGMRLEDVSLETFFNHPVRKADLKLS